MGPKSVQYLYIYVCGHIIFEDINIRDYFWTFAIKPRKICACAHYIYFNLHIHSSYFNFKLFTLRTYKWSATLKKSIKMDRNKWYYLFGGEVIMVKGLLGLFVTSINSINALHFTSHVSMRGKKCPKFKYVGYIWKLV